jgi:4-hydroxy-tetrahydrodipicolinate synthase
MTALVTPMRDGKVDFEAYTKLVEWQITSGIDALVAVGTEHEVREAIRTLVPEYSEFTPRVPFADVEVPVGTTGTGVAATIRRATAPASGPVGNPLEQGKAPAVNIVRAS